MELKSEKSIIEYLKTLPDDTIIKYYLDVEFSPFPVLVIDEYTRRFKRKTRDEIVKDLKLQTRLARKKAKDLGRFAKRQKLVDDVTKEKSQEILKQAKKKGYAISEKIAKKSGLLGSKLKKSTTSGVQKGITASKKIKTPRTQQLELLEKLGELKKAGVITPREFNQKKKKILEKI